MGIKNKLKYLVIASFFIFSILGAFASVNYLHDTIATNYSDGETIRGNINLKLNNEPGDLRITSNFPGNLTLLELIRNQSLTEGIEYNCSTNNCLNDYNSAGVINNIGISEGVDYVGFKIHGSGIEVTDAKLKISSNSPSSCTPNLYVDLLSDGQNILTTNQGSGESCGVKHVGCYNPSNAALANIVTGKEYCEKISIPSGPSFIIGAVIKQGSGESNLTMKLYDFDSTSLLGSCKLLQNSQATQSLSCGVNYSSYETKEYYVCVSTSLNNGYQIGQETASPTCGTAQGFNTLNSDFNIFAETVKYAASPVLIINQTTYNKAFSLDLKQAINQYIQYIYNGDCQDDCFIPIKIFGGNQVASFSDAQLSYDSFGASLNPLQEVHDLSYDSSKITSNNLTIDISKAGFVIPIGSNENNFRIYINGGSLLSKTISIKKSFLFDVNPKSIAFGQNVKFTASSSSTNITKTIWNFGDGSIIQTINGSSVNHVFTKNNSYFEINVTAISNQTQAIRQFRIYIGNPKDIANLTIGEYKRRITNITSQINSYPSWAVQRIQNIVRLNNLTSELNVLELDYNNASTEQEYQKVMLDLINLDVPAYVSPVTSADNLPLSLGYESFNVNYIEQIGNKDLDNALLRDQVVAWMNDNFNAEISFKKIERIGNNGAESIGTLFTIKTNPISAIETNAYLILGQDIENTGLYKANYNPLSVTSGVDYILLDSSASQVFEFFVDGDIDAELLGAYIAPSIEILGDIKAPSGECNLNNICDSGEDLSTCPEDCSKKWFKFTLIGWIILAFAGFIAYIILQEWYKRNYQKSLFPESNDLFNLVNFIYNARKSGLDDGEIKSKLRQQKWSSERIRFALRKIDGKRVGMFEIPIFTRREHKEIVKQIANRQPEGIVNARFIKRHSYP